LTHWIQEGFKSILKTIAIAPENTLSQNWTIARGWLESFGQKPSQTLSISAIKPPAIQEQCSIAWGEVVVLLEERKQVLRII
jgi:hypothetical protein